MKTVLITGSSSGIGKATVELFSSKGWNVVATMRHPENVKNFHWPKNVKILELDVTKPKTIHQARISAEKLFGGVDVLINNAGYGLFGALETCSEKQILDQFDTNVFGVVAVLKEFLPSMRKRNEGTIVNVTSIVGKVTLPYMGYYCATKYALESLSEALWHEISSTNIRVKIVEPGTTETNFVKGKIVGDVPLSFYEKEMKEIRNETSWKGSSQESIAQIIYQASTDTSKKLRYPAGKFVGSFLLLKKILPEFLYLKLIKRFSS